MNTAEIEKLLEKYYEGLTSVEEERFLSEYFLGDAVPPHLRIHAGQFRYYNLSSSEEITDPLFEMKFLDRINNDPVPKVRKKAILFYYFSGIAAALLILIGLVFSFRDSVREETPVAGMTVSDPSHAFAQTCNILALVSSNLNKGIEKIQCLGQFEKAMQKTQMLSKFYQYETLIINPDPFQGRP